MAETFLQELTRRGLKFHRIIRHKVIQWQCAMFFFSNEELNSFYLRHTEDIYLRVFKRCTKGSQGYAIAPSMLPKSIALVRQYSVRKLQTHQRW